ncbi:proline-rich protein 18-like [Syngnathus typhle]|uniref:proline-rich protein 18-like n=1 Tax=Syngnathus typhle TaxID=161592 RepID=UPI002A6ADC01|nr:proline-rich protein 18-like [Syngnathus typhle]
MARDARKYLASFFSTPFRRKTQLLAYLFLCVSKMPFIPPVCVAGGKAEGKAEEGKAEGEAAPLKESASVKERLVSNLKQLGKKSRLPAAAKELSEPRKKGVSSRGGLPESLPASRTGESSAKSRQVRPRGKARPEETRFTLTLTPEAVLLLQRRSNSSSTKAVSGSVPDSRRARRGLQSAPSHGRAAALVRTRSDVSSMVKVSLLNEHHRYDDVEYEDEGDGQVDQRVVLKCTEWLQGLENVPVGRRKRAGAKSS